MTSRRSRGVPGWVLGLSGLAFVATLVLAVLHFQRLPEGPEPIAWDQEVCAHCRMQISERGFAAQLQLKDGQVLNFDDPGCLMKKWKELGTPAPHAIWFHHLREDRWLSADQVGFVPVTPTPMGYGLGAVDKGTQGAVDLEQARAQLKNPRGEG